MNEIKPMPQPSPPHEKKLTPASLLNLAIIYLVWGSTYLAIRVAVRDEGGFPPFSMAMMRVFTAGCLLLLWAWLSKRRIKPTKVEWITILASGVLLWNGGNGLVVWAEQHADSGLTALIVAASPIWTAILAALLDRKAPSRLLVGSLLVGFTGIGLLAAPSFRSGVRSDLLSTLALIGASLSWSLGSVLQARRPVAISPRASSAYQMLVAGVGFFILARLTGEAEPAPTAAAWLAWGYLVIFGSVLAFTAYVTALRQLPTNVVMTHAYVNPVIAVILGWLILNEEITVWTVAGSALVLLGVYGVFRQRSIQKN